MNAKHILPWIAILASPVVLLVSYFQGMWLLEEYRFFPVLLIAFFFVLSQRWTGTVKGPAVKSWPFISIGTIALFLAVWFWSPWLGIISWVFFFGAFLISQDDATWSLFSPWFILLHLIRLPLNLDLDLSRWLQSATAGVSSVALDTLSISHYSQGNVIHLVDKSLSVEEACSGVQSLFALLFVSTLIVVWNRRSNFLLPAYWGVACWWAASMNILRVTAIAVTHEKLNLDLSTGVAHTILGYACLGIAIALLLSTDRLIQVLFYPLPNQPRDTNPVAMLWNHLLRLVDDSPATGSSVKPLTISFAIFAYLVVLVALPIQLSRWYFNSSEPILVGQLPLIQFESSVIEGKLEGVVVTGFERFRDSRDETVGVNADVWHLTVQETPARFAVSQPYVEYHELTYCYQAIDYKVVDRKVISSSDATIDWPMVQVRVENTVGTPGILIFAGLDNRGEPVNPQNEGFVAGLKGRLLGRELTPRGYDVLMLQIWIPDVSATFDEQDVLTSFERMRDLVRASVVER